MAIKIAKSARQKDEEAKLRAEVENAPGWHRKAQPDDDCDGCDEKKKRARAQKAEAEVKDDDASS